MNDNSDQPTHVHLGQHSDRCRECDAAVGEAHDEGCWTARCLVTGLNRVGCTADHDCGHDLWTGWWPGQLECEQLGWTVRPGVPDIGRLYSEAVWDPERCLWIKPM